MPVVLAIAVGASTLGGGFVFDDHYAIQQNPVVQGELPLGAAWTRDFWGAPLDAGARTYRPLVVGLWRGLVASSGAAWLFRLVSTLAHAGCTALAQRWSAQLFAGRRNARSMALVVAMLFAVHPVHAEALGANVAHADLLGALTGLAAVSVGVDGRGRSLLTAALLAASGLCKETFVVFAVVLGVQVALERGRSGAKQLVPALLVTVILVSLHLSIDRSRALDPFNNLGLAAEDVVTHLAWGLFMIGRGAAMTIVPVGSSPVHDYASVTLAPSDLWPFAALGAAVLGLGLGLGLWAVVAPRERIAMLLGLGLWLAPLTLASNLLFDTLTGLAERLLYVPSLGVVVVGVALGARLVECMEVRPRATALVIALVVLASIVGGWPARRAWRSPSRLWRRAASVTPASMRAHANLGATLLNEGSVEAGVLHVTISRHIAESFPEPVSATHWRDLERMPVERAVIEAPGELAGADEGCAFASRVLAVVNQTRPDLAAGLAPVWAQRWCGPTGLVTRGGG